VSSGFAARVDDALLGSCCLGDHRVTVVMGRWETEMPVVVAGAEAGTGGGPRFGGYPLIVGLGPVRLLRRPPPRWRPRLRMGYWAGVTGRRRGCRSRGDRRSAPRHTTPVRTMRRVALRPKPGESIRKCCENAGCFFSPLLQLVRVTLSWLPISKVTSRQKESRGPHARVRDLIWLMPN
jgi:hypothetical protein